MAERAMHVSPSPKPGPRPRSTRPTGLRPSHQSRETPFRQTAPRKPLRHSEHGVPKRRVGNDVPRQRKPERPQRPPREPREPRPPLDKATNRRLWLGVFALAAVAFVFAIFEAPQFEATRTQVSGHARTSDGAIDAALAVTDDQALITYDTREAAARIEQLPWVERASVVRQWPSTLRVVVREHAVTAGIGDESGQRWFVAGSDRYAIEESSTPPAGVPLIIADDSIIESVALGEPIERIERVYDLALEVPGQLDPWISLWSVDGDGVVAANLTGSAHAVFGAAGDTRTQFVSLASILDGGPSLTCIEQIDLSTPDTPVIHRNPACIAVSRDVAS